MKKIELLDTVATLKSIAANRLTLVEAKYDSISNLPVGLVGTVVEIYENQSNKYLVEFSDNEGCEYAMAILNEDEILVLQYELAIA